METLFMPLVIDQANDYDASLTLTSNYLHYNQQEVHQGKDAAIQISAMATGTT